MKTLLISIFGLTVLDVGFTYWGIVVGYIEEANPLLAEVFHSKPELTSLILVALVAFLLSVIWHYHDRARRIIYLLLPGLLLVKLAIMGMHINWLMQI